MKKFFLLLLLSCSLQCLVAQKKDSLQPRPITMAEYDKAKNFTIKDLDKDTYAKFENAFILDRYEMRKPYFITGDDGLKKRMDLYKLIAKEGMQELGTVIFYTNEKGKLYTALQPNFTANSKVWEKYFEDIHTIDKEEKNFVLKLSYILSKEMSFQLYKAINKGRDMKEESGTYGSDICFPGNQMVAMADGSAKPLFKIKKGDRVITVNPATKQSVPATVTQLVQHEAKNYAITQLLLIAADQTSTEQGVAIHLSAKALLATPNHPVAVRGKKIAMSQISIGDEIVSPNVQTGVLQTYTVFNKKESAGGYQKVYNMVLSIGGSFVLDGVMVLQK